MCEVARKEWTASVRQLVVRGSRRATCHSNRPSRRMNGSNVRCPEASGDHSFPTDRRKSRMDGTQRTPVSVKSMSRLRESRTDRGEAPAAT
eukprot:1245929-Pleurochrysis_carterae.AAC.3